MSHSNGSVHVDSGFVSMKGDVDASRIKAMTDKEIQRMKQVLTAIFLVAFHRLD